MMKLRPSLKNLVKAALNSLIALTLFFGCSPLPKGATYTIENVADSLKKIAFEEYRIPIVSKLAGQTLWIYIPLKEDIFIDSEKPQEYVKRFDLNAVEGTLEDTTLNFSYNIQEVPETKESQNKKISPDAGDKLNKILRTVRRVVFSLKHHTNEPKFFVTVTTDIKSGMEMLDITYIDDLKKASYEMISWTEYQHRSLQDMRIVLEAVDDEEGKHLEFKDIAMKEFIIEQIRQRVRSKFNRPEVEKGADIDKEIFKTIKNVVEIYNFKDFSSLELKNLATENKVSLTKAQVLEKIKE